jgi:hypothetical protein
MRPSRITGGAGDAHTPLGAMNRAGLAIRRAGEMRMLTSDWLIQSQLYAAARILSPQPFCLRLI